jgi:solute:Na+ symporter, SSS family
MSGAFRLLAEGAFDLSGYQYTGWVITGIVVFFFVRLAIGFWAASKVSNASDYIVAGRGLPIYMTAASIMATWFAAETLMGASTKGYSYGMQGAILDPLGAVVCLLISGMFFIRLMRRARYLTVVDFFSKRYGKEVDLIASILQIVAYLVWTAAQFVAGAHVVHSLLGWPDWAGMLLVGVVVTGYTTMGGMLADTLLDFIQMFFTAGGITAVFLYLLKEVGGWEGLMACTDTLYVKNEPFAIMPIQGYGYLGYTGMTGWLYWISAWITIGFGSIATQDLMQRSMSARNEATSVWGSYIAALLYFVFGVMSPLIGIMIFKLDPPALNKDHLEGLLVVASQTYLPVWLNVLFMAALTSAMMSTSDSAILAGASVYTENILPFFSKTEVNEVQKLWWTRFMVIVIGTACIGIAWLIGDSYNLAMMAWSVLLVGMSVPFVCGMYWQSANRLGALASIIGGIGTWIAGVFYYLGETKVANTTDGVIGWDDAIWDAVYIASPWAVLVSLAAMVAVTLATRRIEPPLPLTDTDGNPLALDNRLGLISPLAIFRHEPAPISAASDTPA